MERKIILRPSLALALIFSSSFSSTLNAGDLSYNYIEGEYLISESSDDVELDSNFGINGSYRITDQVFVFGSFSTGSGTGKISELNLDIDIDADYFGFGAGYIYPLNSTWDANFTLGYFQTQTDVSNLPRGIDYSGDKDTGIDIAAGVRGMLAPKIELSAFLEYSKDDDSNASVNLSGQYYLLDNVSVGGSVDIDSDGSGFFAKARMYF